MKTTLAACVTCTVVFAVSVQRYFDGMDGYGILAVAASLCMAAAAGSLGAQLADRHTEAPTSVS